ncbi:nodulation protein NfeD [Geomonas sp. RF6]|uniref:NfeD family protein n=1 Tax=Geomonas sp. RF6 TaxID=2897342 RepID=UPI001E2BC885|nr:nodulation protein NfeD [Geomonas sp. RF6]UFS70350.1 nodulation protein NfeD [Geomonas sp. RF6]
MTTMCVLFAALLVLVLPQQTIGGAPEISLLSVHGPITPVTSEYLRRNIEEAGARGDQLVLVEMDTPGGLDTAMREAVQAVFGSRVPVAVYVTPSGARAASAGAVIALAADVCAMSPGTNIGAAHPVNIGSQPDKVMGTKIVNDAAAYLEGIAGRRGRNIDLAGKMVRESISLTAERALQEKVIDIVASDRHDLLKKLEGRRLVRGEKETQLHLSGARITTHGMSVRERILDAVCNPDVAYLLMLAGFLGIFFELANPGVILPGVIGSISLLLAFFAFQTLPVDYAGLLLIVVAIVLFAAEVKIVSHGILGAGGVIALIFGSLLLFPSKEPYLRLSWEVLGGTVLVVTLFFLVVIAKVVEAHRQRPVTGIEGMLGERGVALTDIMPEGKVLVHGEYWNATSRDPISQDEKVEVTAVDGLRVTVRKV